MNFIGDNTGLDAKVMQNNTVLMFPAENNFMFHKYASVHKLLIHNTLITQYY